MAPLGQMVLKLLEQIGVPVTCDHVVLQMAGRYQVDASVLEPLVRRSLQGGVQLGYVHYENGKFSIKPFQSYLGTWNQTQQRQAVFNQWVLDNTDMEEGYGSSMNGHSSTASISDIPFNLTISDDGPTGANNNNGTANSNGHSI